MAFTQVNGDNAWYEDQALSKTAPTTDAADGVPTKDCRNFVVVLEANAGQTISGGTLRGYIYDTAIGSWCRAAALDITPTTAVRQSAAVVTAADIKRGDDSRIQWVTSSVTVSGGTTARVYILGSA